MLGNSLLVGVANTPEARDAAALGLRIRAVSEGELHWVTAATDVLANVSAVRRRLDVDRLHQALIEGATLEVTTALHGLVDEKELAQLLVTRLGRPEHVLEAYSREVNADLIVLGGRVRSPTQMLPRRRVARHLLRAGELPILIARAGSGDFDRVLVAVDSSQAASPTIRAAAELAHLLQVGLEALHVSPELPPFPESEQAVDRRELESDQEEQVERELWPLLPSGTPRRIVRGLPVPEICAAAAEGASTLLVVGAQGRGWISRLLLGSTTEALLSALPSSLMVVPTLAPTQTVA